MLPICLSAPSALYRFGTILHNFHTSSWRTSYNPSGLIRCCKPWFSLFFLTYHNITRVTQLHMMYFFESRTVGLARCAGRCVITYVQRRCQGRTCRLAMLDVSPGKWHSSMLLKDNGNFLHRSTYYDHSSITWVTLSTSMRYRRMMNNSANAFQSWYSSL